MSGCRKLSPTIVLAPTFVLVLLAGCVGAPEPLDLPPQALVVSYAACEPAAAEPTPPRGIDAILFAVAAPPEGPAVLTAAAAVVRDRGTPFHGSSRLPIGSRWLAADEASAYATALLEMPPHAAQRLGDASGVVASGARTTVTVENLPLPALRLERGVHGLGITLVSAPSDEEPGEALLLAEPLRDGATAVLFVPSQSSRPAGHVLVVRAGSTPDPEAQASMQQALAAAQAATDAPSGSRPRAFEVARRAFGEHNRRPALLALLAPYRLEAPVDLVLAGDERALIRLTESITDVDPTAADAAWRIERAAWTGLLPRAERGELPPALAAAFSRHLGSVADDATTLRQLLETSTDAATFRAALRDENLAALDDRDAALRFVACRWLQANGGAPNGYDPLADKDARRAALRRHRAVEGSAEANEGSR